MRQRERPFVGKKAKVPEKKMPSWALLLLLITGMPLLTFLFLMFLRSAKACSCRCISIRKSNVNMGDHNTIDVEGVKGVKGELHSKKPSQMQRSREQPPSSFPSSFPSSNARVRQPPTIVLQYGASRPADPKAQPGKKAQNMQKVQKIQTSMQLPKSALK